MKKMSVCLLFLSLLLSSVSLLAEDLTGTIRDINHASHSFGLEASVIYRVYVNAGTHYETGRDEIGFQGVRQGDRIQLQAVRQANGTLVAKEIKVLENLTPVQDLVQNNIDAKLGQRFLLGVGQMAHIRKNKEILLQIQAVNFINTLCKQGYDCKGEGAVGMQLKVSQGPEVQEILLTSRGQRKPLYPVVMELFNYKVSLIEAGEDVVLLVVEGK